MMKDAEILKNYEKTGMLQIIHILYTNGPLRASELQTKIICSNDPYYAARNELEDLDIITKTITNRSSYVLYTLTDRGKRIAEHLKAITSIISD